MAADVLVHIGEDAHHFHDEQIRSTQGPSDFRSPSDRRKTEFIDIVNLERASPVGVGRDLRVRSGLRNRHRALARFAFSAPIAYGSGTAGRAAVGPCHSRIIAILRVPLGPIPKIIDYRKYAFWRRFDGRRALNNEHWGLARGVEENRDYHHCSDGKSAQNHSQPIFSGLFPAKDPRVSFSEVEMTRFLRLAR